MNTATRPFRLFRYPTTHCLAVMDLTLRGIHADCGLGYDDAFRRDPIEVDLVHCMVAASLGKN